MANGSGDLKTFKAYSESLNREVNIAGGMLGAVENNNFHSFKHDLHRCNRLSDGQTTLLWKELTAKDSTQIAAMRALAPATPSPNSILHILESKKPKGKGTIAGLSGANMGDYFSEDADYGTSALDALLAEGEKREGVKVSPKPSGKSSRG